MANNQRPHMQWLHTKFQPPSFETEAVVREDSNVSDKLGIFIWISKLLERLRESKLFKYALPHQG